MPLPTIPFPGRKEALEKITRYSNYPLMFYRTNDWTHSRRVAYLAQNIYRDIKGLIPTIDEQKMILMAMVHDDPEMLIGDEQASHKSKMTKEQLDELENKERNAIAELGRKFPESIEGYSYPELMTEVLEIQTPESQIVKFADKFDAFGEALHEIFAGNQTFFINVTNHFGYLPTPVESYMHWFAKCDTILTHLNKAFESNIQWFTAHKDTTDLREITKNKTPHTRESLEKETGYWWYDQWKKAVLEHGEDEDIEAILKQTEFPSS